MKIFKESQGEKGKDQSKKEQRQGIVMVQTIGDTFLNENGDRGPAGKQFLQENMGRINQQDLVTDWI